MNPTKNTRHCFTTVALAASLAPSITLALPGCGDVAPNEEPKELAVMREAIGEPSCATAAPDASFSGGANYYSPTAYSNPDCFKAATVDVQSYSAKFIGPGDIPGGTYVEWTGGVPGTATECANSWVRADLYRKSGDVWMFVTSSESHGHWVGGFVGCWLPGAAFTQLQAGQTYRFSVTARTHATSDARTRPLSVVSREPVKI